MHYKHWLYFDVTRDRSRALCRSDVSGGRLVQLRPVARILSVGGPKVLAGGPSQCTRNIQSLNDHHDHRILTCSVTQRSDVLYYKQYTTEQLYAANIRPWLNVK